MFMLWVPATPFRPVIRVCAGVRGLLMWVSGTVTTHAVREYRLLIGVQDQANRL
jgi:hypothetical protein